MVCFVNIREGVREREYRGSGSERDRMTRMTRHNQKVSTHSINSSHKLQEVNYFAEKSKKGADVFRLTSDVQYQHSSTFLLLVRKCDTVVWHITYSVTHRFTHRSSPLHTKRPNRCYIVFTFGPQVAELTSSLCSVQLHTQLLCPSRRPMTSLAGVFELQSILGKTKCSKPISTPPYAGHTRSQWEYIKASDVNITLSSGGNPLPVL